MKKILILILLSHFSPHSEPVVMNQDDPFPVPPGIEQNVIFWEKMFRTFSIHQVVIHDSEHLEVIYEVLDFRDSPNISKSRKNAEVRKCINKYRAILRRIAKNPSDPSRLSEEELAVYRKFDSIEEKNKFITATTRLRAQTGIRERFREGYHRSKQYITEFRRIFRRHGLPEELVYLPHVESSFNADAYSRSGAVGIWQFTKSTGKIYLEINGSVDQRKDPYLSTRAAARHLRKNFIALGDWPLAITAYNHGLSGVKRATRAVNSTDISKIVKEYRGRSFGFASRNFYAEFIASMNVAKEYEALDSPSDWAGELKSMLTSLYLP